MKKILIVATVGSFIDSFLKEHVKILQEMDYEVHFAANMHYGGKTLHEIGVVTYDLAIQRNPFSGKNIKAYRQLKKLMEEQRFDMVHCHTPMGGVLGRIAARRCGIKRILYTAHGFHFYQGAPIQNWLLYYPVERWLARYTDGLITINQEDHQRAKTFKLRNGGKVYDIPGVGVDVEKIRGVKVDRNKKREELGIGTDKIVLLSVGELNRNKNHGVILQAMAELHDPKLVYIICGKGKLENELKRLAQSLNIEKQLILLGFRKDVIEICKVSDIFCFPSKREGLPVALMEAMAAGLPVICSRIRGNVDLVEEGVNGYLIGTKENNQYAYRIQECVRNKKYKINFFKYKNTLVEKFSVDNVSKLVREIMKTNMI